MTQFLTDQVAIVTGGTSGIGLATVERFVSAGARVMIADIQDEAGAELVARLGDTVAYQRTDVTRESAIADVVDATVERFGRLDIMFNNAGAQGDPNALLDIEQEGFEKTLSLLTSSVMFGHKHAARQFRAQGTGGAIISTASAAAVQGGLSSVGYTVAKHAVIGVVRQAVAELSPLGIRSNAIVPGVIMSPIMPRTFGIPDEQAEDFSAFLGEWMARSQPLGRTGTPDDIARAALFLASELGEFVTGAVLPVDGGMTAVNQGTFLADLGTARAEFERRQAEKSAA